MPSPLRSRLGVLVPALAVILAYLILPPAGALDKADHAAFAVCHRIAARTFTFDGRPLPLCARCSGMYLGATGALGALILTGRARSGRFPRRPWWILLAAFSAAWALDGVNSFLTLIPGLPHLYEPNNLLRLGTGALQGVTLAVVLLPALNLSVWRTPGLDAPLDHPRDLALVLAGAALLALPVKTQLPFLLYPLALISGLAIVGLLGIVNIMIVLVVTRREGRADNAWQAVAPAFAGIALACAELAAIAAVRGWLTVRFGLPF